MVVIAEVVLPASPGRSWSLGQEVEVTAPGARVRLLAGPPGAETEVSARSVPPAGVVRLLDDPGHDYPPSFPAGHGVRLVVEHDSPHARARVAFLHHGAECGPA